MSTTGYTNKDKPFTFPLILEARKHENIVLTENGKVNGKVIYLGFTNGSGTCDKKRNPIKIRTV